MVSVERGGCWKKMQVKGRRSEGRRVKGRRSEGRRVRGKGKKK